MNCTICGAPFVLGNPDLHASCREKENAAVTVKRVFKYTPDSGPVLTLLLMADGSVRWDNSEP